MKICQKVFVEKRKAFDIKDQRKTEDLAKIENENKYSKPFGKQSQKKAPASSS